MPDATLEISRQTLRPRPWEILALLPFGTFIGGLLGASYGVFYGWIILPNSVAVLRTNARASQVSVEQQLQWQQILTKAETIWRIHIIADNVTLGWRAGIVISLLLVIAIAVISKLRCPFWTAAVVQLRVVMGIFGFWLVGGINALVIACIAPEWFHRMMKPDLLPIPGFTLPQNVTPYFLSDAWVYGEVWGVRAGLILATSGCLVSFANKWRQIERESFESGMNIESSR